MNWTWIDDDKSLHHLLDDVSGASAVAVDTEFMRERSFFPRLALLQICVGEKVFLIDPLEVKDLRPLKHFFTNKNVVKIFHACSEDIEVIYNWLKIAPMPIFDTQIAGGLLGIGFSLSYRKLVKEICSVDLVKDQTRSDWLRRPLTEAQCSYAAQDVLYLFQLWQLLVARSDISNKTKWILSDGDLLIHAFNAERHRDHLRITGGGKLSPRQLYTLYELSKWREREAKKRNLPRRWILDDKSCVRLAEEIPHTKKILRNLIGLPANLQEQDAEVILKIFDNCRNVSTEFLPSAIPVPLGRNITKKIKPLKNLIIKIAGELGTVPEILLRSKDYELLLRLSLGEDIDIPYYWNGWRKDLVIQPLKRHLLESS